MRSGLVLGALAVVVAAGVAYWRRTRNRPSAAVTVPASPPTCTCTDADLLATWRSGQTPCSSTPRGWIGLHLCVMRRAESGPTRHATATATYDDAFGFAKVVAHGAFMLPNQVLLRLLSEEPAAAHLEERVFLVARDLDTGRTERRTLRGLLFYDKMVSPHRTADRQRLLDALRSRPNGAQGSHFNVDLGPWLAAEANAHGRFAIVLEAGEHRSAEATVEIAPP